MNARKEKLKKLLHMLPAGLCCIAAAGLLFWAAPMKAQAVPLGSNPNGTLPSGDNASAEGEEGTPDGEEAPEGENGGEAAASTMTVTSVTVTEDRVNVRSDASTNAGIAGKATRNMELAVTGEKEDSSGTVWYAVSFESGGNTINGYIRSDMVEAHMTEQAPAEADPAPEEQPGDVSEPQVSVPNDFFVQYEDDGTGTGTNAWYLYDGIMGNKYRVDTLLSAEETNQSNQKLMEEETGKFKWIIMVMAAVILILIVVLTVLIIKIKSSDDDDYDYDDDDDDGDDDEEEDYEPKKRPFGRLGRRRDEEDEDDEEEEDEEEEYRPVKRASARRASEESASHRARYDEDEEDDDDEPVRRTAKAAKGKGDKNWQTKNFLDDDDLEFEFLDMK